MLGAVAHKDVGGVRLRLWKNLREGGSQVPVVLQRGEEGPAKGHAGKLGPEGLGLGAQLVELVPVHDVGGLEHHVGTALPRQPLQGLGHIVDVQPLPVGQTAQDHTAGEGPALDPAGHPPGDVPLNGLDGLFQGIQVGGAEGHHQNRFLRHSFSPSPGHSRALPEARYSMALQMAAATLLPPFRPRATM